MKNELDHYKYLPHTADAKFVAYGNSIEELFINSALASFNIITETKKVLPKSKYKISLKAKKIESLLFDFLDETLFLLDTEGLLLSKIENMKITKKVDGYHLNCDFFGDYHKNYDVSGNLKAVTYNDMFVKKTRIGWEAQVVIDL